MFSRQDVARLCENSSAIRLIHAACCRVDQDVWTAYFASLLRCLSSSGRASGAAVAVGGNASLKVGFEEAARKMNEFFYRCSRDETMSSTALYQYRNVAVFMLVASYSAIQYPQTSVADSVIDKMIGAMKHAAGHEPARSLAVTALGNVPLILVDRILTSLPLHYGGAAASQAGGHGTHDEEGRRRHHVAPYNSHETSLRTGVAFVYRLIAEGLSPSSLSEHEPIRTKFEHFISTTRVFLCRDGNFHRTELQQLKSHFAVIVHRFCEETFASPCSQPVAPSERIALFELAVVGVWLWSAFEGGSIAVTF